MKNLYKLLFTFLFVCQGLVLAQSERIFIDHITTEEGLSQNDVNCILQDRKGFMWFGTNDGLNRYDGYSFEIFKPEIKNPHSISSNLILTLEEDKDGYIWIGTVGEGLNRFDPVTKQFLRIKHDPDNLETIPSNHIRHLKIDKQGRLWVATTEGVCFIELENNGSEDESGKQKIHYESLPKEVKTGNINSIEEDSEGNIWIGANQALYVLTPQADNQFSIQQIPVITEFSTYGVVAFLPYLNGSMIVATNRGIFLSQKTEKDSFTLRSISDGSYRDFEVDNDNKIWAASPEGLACFRTDEKKGFPTLISLYTNDLRDPNSLNKDVIFSIFKDKYGVIWVGTNGGGINKFDPEKKPFLHYRKTIQSGSINYDKIRSIYEDSQANLWIGTEGGGINFLPENEKPANYTAFQNIAIPRNVFAIKEVQQAKSNYIFFGVQSNPGLYYMAFDKNTSLNRPKELTFYPYIPSAVFTLLNDQDKYLWAGTYNGGLYRIPLEESLENTPPPPFRFNPDNITGISSDIVRSLLKDRRGNIWIGTGNGLNKISAPGTRIENPHFIKYFHSPEDENSLSHNYILALHESSDGNLWIGTLGGGLNKLNPGEDRYEASFIRYDESNGLANNVVKGILEDEEGSLWIATNDGISRFNPKTEEFKNYDTNDGLQSAEFSELACLKRKNGEMLFGGVNGFNVFSPENIQSNTHVPEVVFTSFQVLNQPVLVGQKNNGHVILPKAISETEHISLKHNENSFSFEFAALHYSAPGKNQYLFKLEGFNDDWIPVDAKKRFATYTNLKPGDYTILVKATNNDGVWNDNPASIHIYIAPPFWRTWWAYCIYGIIILGLLWAIRRYTIIGIKEKHQFKLEHLEKEKSEELHQLKLQFFTNISHELRTPLTLISGPMDYLIKAGNGLGYDEREHQYHLIKKNTNYLLRLINQLLDFRKMDRGQMKLNVQYGDINRFIHEITEPFQFIASRKEITYEIQSETPEIWTWFDPDIIEKTLYNLLSNAFRYTPHEGEITVELITLTQSSLKGNQSKRHEVLEIRVKDTGRGISSEQKGKIFERFFKEPQKTNTDKSGTGIGLAYTKGLIELHRGTIHVESELDKGTSFFVAIPLNEKSYEKSEISKTPLTTRSEESDPLAYLSETLLEEDSKDAASVPLVKQANGLPTLLVVDDYEDIRAYIKQVFSKEYYVIEAADGLEAEKIALQTIPDMIISDVMMPKRDGIELCKSLKVDPKTSHIPIILLTAKSSEESELEGLKNGADAYIRKPFNAESLKVRIDNILKHRAELKNRFRREMLLEPEEIALTSTDESFLKKAMDIVEEHMANPDFNVEQMVTEIGMSRSKLYLKLKALTGQSSSEFIRTVRLKRAVQLLETSDLTVKEIMYMTGFNTASYFSKCFKKQFGLVPSEYVKRQLSNQK